MSLPTDSAISPSIKEEEEGEKGKEKEGKEKEGIEEEAEEKVEEEVKQEVEEEGEGEKAEEEDKAEGEGEGVGEDYPDEFVDPISLGLMEDPVICTDGFTYDRKNIEKWFLFFFFPLFSSPFSLVLTIFIPSKKKV